LLKIYEVVICLLKTKRTGHIWPDVMSTLGKLRQEDSKFKVSLGYIVRKKLN
jgi:hypothetical protein